MSSLPLFAHTDTAWKSRLFSCVSARPVRAVKTFSGRLRRVRQVLPMGVWPPRQRTTVTAEGK